MIFDATLLGPMFVDFDDSYASFFTAIRFKFKSLFGEFTESGVYV